MAVGLIKNGADVNAKTDDGWIPLHSGTVFHIFMFNFFNIIFSLKQKKRVGGTKLQ